MGDYIKKETLQDYYKNKLKLLSDFGIKATAKIRTELQACKNEIQLDNTCRAIIIDALK